MPWRKSAWSYRCKAPRSILEKNKKCEKTLFLTTLRGIPHVQKCFLDFFLDFIIAWIFENIALNCFFKIGRWGGGTPHRPLFLSCMESTGYNWPRKTQMSRRKSAWSYCCNAPRSFVIVDCKLRLSNSVTTLSTSFMNFGILAHCELFFVFEKKLKMRKNNTFF